MDTFKKNSDQKTSDDASAFMGWGTIVGAVIGAIVGQFIGHRTLWAMLLGLLGLVIGALIDRSRR